MIWETGGVTRRTQLAVWGFFVLVAGCGSSKRPVLEDLAGHEDLSLFRVQSVRGTRDGDRLAVQAIISDSSSILTVQMHFAVGSPTKLESGTWRWSRNGRDLNGPVSARSVTFLGGQDGPPSIGGTFDLVVDAPISAIYRLTIPLTELRERWKG
jgi:hypothetical protein